jgi:hypothetical protein
MRGVTDNYTQLELRAASESVNFTDGIDLGIVWQEVIFVMQAACMQKGDARKTDFARHAVGFPSEVFQGPKKW